MLSISVSTFRFRFPFPPFTVALLGWLSKNCDENPAHVCPFGGDFELKMLRMRGFSWTTNLKTPVHCRGLQVGWHKFATRIRTCAEFSKFPPKVCACADFRRKICANQPANGYMYSPHTTNSPGRIGRNIEIKIGGDGLPRNQK